MSSLVHHAILAKHHFLLVVEVLCLLLVKNDKRWWLQGNNYQDPSLRQVNRMLNQGMLVGGNTVVRLCWNMFIYRSKIKLWYVYSCTTPMYHLFSPGSPRTKKPDEDCEWRPANLPILSVFSTISVRVLGIKSLSVLDHHHSGAANFGLYSSYWYLWSYPIYTYIYIYIHTYINIYI